MDGSHCVTRSPPGRCAETTTVTNSVPSVLNETTAVEPWSRAGVEQTTLAICPAFPDGTGAQFEAPVNDTDHGAGLLNCSEIVVPAGRPSGSVARTVTVYEGRLMPNSRRPPYCGGRTVVVVVDSVVVGSAVVVVASIVVVGACVVALVGALVGALVAGALIWVAMRRRHRASATAHVPLTPGEPV